MSGYAIEVQRRKVSDTGYGREPFVATATRDGRLVAVQFGSQPGIAFQKAWRMVQEEREREPVAVTLA